MIIFAKIKDKLVDNSKIITAYEKFKKETRQKFEK